MRSLARIRKRDGRCYELAFKAIVNEPEAKGLKLVHGTVYNDQLGKRMGHAWIIFPDGLRLYDPVLNKGFLQRTYVEKYAAEAEAIYTPKQAAKAWKAAGHSGPWHDSGLRA